MRIAMIEETARGLRPPGGRVAQANECGTWSSAGCAEQTFAPGATGPREPAKPPFFALAGQPPRLMPTLAEVAVAGQRDKLTAGITAKASGSRALQEGNRDEDTGQAGSPRSGRGLGLGEHR